MAYAIAELLSSGWWAAHHNDLDMRDNPLQYEDELSAFIDDLQMAFDHISSPDE